MEGLSPFVAWSCLYPPSVPPSPPSVGCDREGGGRRSRNERTADFKVELFSENQQCSYVTHFASACLSSEQKLSNLLQQKDYVGAVGLAISLDQPFRVLTILTGQPGSDAMHSRILSNCPPLAAHLCLTELLDEGGSEGVFSDTVQALREDQVGEYIVYT